MLTTDLKIAFNNALVLVKREKKKYVVFHASTKEIPLAKAGLCPIEEFSDNLQYIARGNKREMLIDCIIGYNESTKSVFVLKDKKKIHNMLFDKKIK